MMGSQLSEQWIGRPAPLPAVAATVGPGRPGRVLLADDCLVTSAILRFILEKAGLTVETADNGRSAVEKAIQETYDLVIMDMEMPELDGYEATRTLRRDGYRGPVVALTAHNLPGDQVRCQEAGCDAYLTKPVDKTALLRLVTQHLTGGAAACLAEPRASDSPGPPKELVLSYRRALPRKAEAMANALGSGDLPGLTALAHKLKGSAGMYGLPRLSEMASLLEDACHAGREECYLADLLQNLKVLCAESAQG